MDQRALLRRISIALILLLTPGCPGPEEAAPRETVRSKNGVRNGAQTYFTTTEDGWKIALHRVKPDSPRADLVPVILCHGLGYNNRFWRLDDEHNFAHHLADAGFDTWGVDLRGGGDSTKPVWRVLRMPEIGPGELSRLRVASQDWSADECIRYDVPAAIDLVCKETGSKKVAWVGHSLGGMIMFGHLSQTGDERVLCFASVAAPMFIPRPTNNILRDIRGFRLLMMMVNNRWQALAGAATLSRLKTPIDMLFYNTDNVDVPVIMELFLHATEDIPSGMIEQTLALAKTGEFISSDGKINYTEEARRVDVPILMLAGKADNMADPEGVRYIYHRVSSKDKTFRLFGLANGNACDYGHDDLIIGKHAPQEVFPFLRDWLNRTARMPSGSPPK